MFGECCSAEPHASPSSTALASLWEFNQELGGGVPQSRCALFDCAGFPWKKQIRGAYSKEVNVLIKDLDNENCILGLAHVH